MISLTAQANTTTTGEKFWLLQKEEEVEEEEPCSLVVLQTQLRGSGDDGLHGDGPRPQVRARPGGGECQVAGPAEKLPGRVRVDPGQLWPGTHSLSLQPGGCQAGAEPGHHCGEEEIGEIQ